MDIILDNTRADTLILQLIRRVLSHEKHDEAHMKLKQDCIENAVLRLQLNLDADLDDDSEVHFVDSLLSLLSVHLDLVSPLMITQILNCISYHQEAKIIIKYIPLLCSDSHSLVTQVLEQFNGLLMEDRGFLLVILKALFEISTIMRTENNLARKEFVKLGIQGLNMLPEEELPLIFKMLLSCVKEKNIEKSCYPILLKRCFNNNDLGLKISEVIAEHLHSNHTLDFNNLNGLIRAIFNINDLSNYTPFDLLCAISLLNIKENGSKIRHAWFEISSRTLSKDLLFSVFLLAGKSKVLISSKGVERLLFLSLDYFNINTNNTGRMTDLVINVIQRHESIKYHVLEKLVNQHGKYSQTLYEISCVEPLLLVCCRQKLDKLLFSSTNSELILCQALANTVIAESNENFMILLQKKIFLLINNVNATEQAEYSLHDLPALVLVDLLNQNSEIITGTITNAFFQWCINCIKLNLGVHNVLVSYSLLYKIKDKINLDELEEEIFKEKQINNINIDEYASKLAHEFTIDSQHKKISDLLMIFDISLKAMALRLAYESKSSSFKAKFNNFWIEAVEPEVFEVSPSYIKEFTSINNKRAKAYDRESSLRFLYGLFFKIRILDLLINSNHYDGENELFSAVKQCLLAILKAVDCIPILLKFDEYSKELLLSEIKIIKLPPKVVIDCLISIINMDSYNVDDVLYINCGLKYLMTVVLQDYVRTNRESVQDVYNLLHYHDFLKILLNLKDPRILIVTNLPSEFLREFQALRVAIISNMREITICLNLNEYVFPDFSKDIENETDFTIGSLLLNILGNDKDVARYGFILLNQCNKLRCNADEKFSKIIPYPTRHFKGRADLNLTNIIPIAFKSRRRYNNELRKLINDDFEDTAQFQYLRYVFLSICKSMNIASQLNFTNAIIQNIETFTTSEKKFLLANFDDHDEVLQSLNTQTLFTYIELVFLSSLWITDKVMESFKLDTTKANNSGNKRKREDADEHVRDFKGERIIESLSSKLGVVIQLLSNDIVPSFLKATAVLYQMGGHSNIKIFMHKVASLLTDYFNLLVVRIDELIPYKKLKKCKYSDFEKSIRFLLQQTITLCDTALLQVVSLPNVAMRLKTLCNSIANQL